MDTRYNMARAATPASPVETQAISADLLKPVAAAVAALLTTWLLTKTFGATQIALLVQAVVTFVAGYVVGPTPVDSLLAKLRLSKKLLAAAVVAAGTAVVTWIATGTFNDAEVSSVISAALGIVLAMLSPPDAVVPAKVRVRGHRRRRRRARR